MSQVAEVASLLQQLEEDGGRMSEGGDSALLYTLHTTLYTIHLKLINVLSHSYQLELLSLAAAQGDG